MSPIAKSSNAAALLVLLPAAGLFALLKQRCKLGELEKCCIFKATGTEKK